MQLQLTNLNPQAPPAALADGVYPEPEPQRNLSRMIDEQLVRFETSNQKHRIR